MSTVDVAVEELCEERGHYAESAFPHDQGGEGIVCACGLPWTPGEGCPFVQGAAALAPLLPQAQPDEAVRAAMTALADKWESIAEEQKPHLGCLDMHRHLAGELRAALSSPAPADQDAEVPS